MDIMRPALSFGNLLISPATAPDPNAIDPFDGVTAFPPIAMESAPVAPLLS